MMTLCTKMMATTQGMASHDRDCQDAYLMMLPRIRESEQCRVGGATSAACHQSPLVSADWHNAHAQTVERSPILEVASAKPRLGIGERFDLFRHPPLRMALASDWSSLCEVVVSRIVHMPFSEATAAPFQTVTRWRWRCRCVLQSISRDGVCMTGRVYGSWTCTYDARGGEDDLSTATSHSPTMLQWPAALRPIYAQEWCSYVYVHVLVWMRVRCVSSHACMCACEFAEFSRVFLHWGSCTGCWLCNGLQLFVFSAVVRVCWRGPWTPMLPYTALFSFSPVKSSSSARRIYEASCT